MLQFGGFHQWWVSQDRCFIVENFMKLDDLGVALFQETSIYGSCRSFPHSRTICYML